MAADGDRKDRKKEQLDGPLDFLGGDDEDGWAAALEEWDQALGGAIDDSAVAPPAAATAGAAERLFAQQAESEAQPEQTVAEITVEEPPSVVSEPAQALGGLLGNAAVDEEVLREAAKQAPPRASSNLAADLGLLLEEPARPQPATRQGPLSNIPTPARSFEAVQEFEEDRTPVHLPAQGDAPSRELPPGVDLDLDGLMEGLGIFGDSPTPAPVMPPPELPPAAELPAAPSALAPHSEKGALAPAPALRQEAVPPLAEMERYDDILGGEVLPKPKAPPVEAQPSVIPDDLDDLAVEEPAREPPPLPPELAALDIATLRVAERGEAVVPLRVYWEHLGELLEEELDRTDSSSRAAAMMFMAGRTAEELGESEDAVDHYREVLVHQPSYVPALRALRRLHTQRKEPDQVAEVLEQMASKVGEDERQAVLATRAELLWTCTGDDAGARDLAESLGHDLRLLLLRSDLAAATGNEEELAATLGKLAEQLEDAAQRSSLRLEQGHCLEALGRAPAAREAYDKACQDDASCAGALEGLARVAVALGDPAALARALAQSATGSSLWTARRIRRAATLARHHHLDEVVQLRRAAELAPDDAFIHEELAEGLRLDGDAQGALQAYCALAAATPNPRHQALALLDAALIDEEALDRSEEAAALYEQARARCPELVRIGSSLQRLHLANHSPEIRLAAHRQAALEHEGCWRALHHLRAATILDEELRRDGVAEELLECLSHDAANRRARAQLETLFRDSGELDRLATLSDAAAAATTQRAEALHYQSQAALIFEARLGQPEAALRRYRQVRESDAECASAAWGEQRVLATMGRAEELIEALAREATNTPDGRRAAHLWTTCGDLRWMQGRDEDAASRYYRQALEREANYLPATTSLTLLYAGRREWDQLGELWSSWSTALPGDSPQRKGVLLRIAALQEKELGSPTMALDCYEAALAAPHPAPGAREGLARSLREADRLDRLVEVLEGELAASADAATRFAILICAAELVGRCGMGWQEAEMRYRRALEEQPDHPMARLALCELYAAQSAWQPLTELLLEDLHRSTEDSARLVLYERLADISLQRGDSAGARPSYESILLLDPTHLGALRFLQRQALGAQDWTRLAYLLQEEGKHSSSRRDRAAVWLSLAHQLALSGAVPPVGEDAMLSEQAAWRLMFQEDQTSVLALRRLVETSSNNEQRSELSRYYRALSAAMQQSREAAIYLARAGEVEEGAGLDSFRDAIEHLPNYLAAVYELRDRALRAEDWETVAFAAEAEVAATLRPERSTAAALLAGEVALSKLGDNERAIQAYRTALGADPANRMAFNQLRLLFEQGQQWEQLVELLSARTQVERSRPRLLELYRTVAQLADERLQQRERAKRSLRVLLKLNPEDREALTSLAALCTADEEWTEAAHALLRLARQEQDQGALRELLLGLGRIFQEKAPDADRAIGCFRKVIGLDPDNIEALDRLGQLYVQNGDFKRALSTTTALLEKESLLERKVDVLLRIARIYEDGLKDAHQAALTYRRTVELAPLDLRAISELIGYFTRQGDQRSLMVHIDRSVATMRGRLKHDPFDAFAYQALFKIFGWRKAPDARFCCAEVLDVLGKAGAEEREFLNARVAAVGAPGQALADREGDELVFQSGIPGGFRHVFRLIAEPLAHNYAADLRTHGASKADRIADVDHPLRRLGDVLARDFAVPAYEIYVLKSKPTALLVENTEPPAILVGKALLHEATEAELLFLLARSLWIISRAMVLPACLRPEELELLVAGVIRQYQAEFQPGDADAVALQETTKRVRRAIPRKLVAELMPFALECSGPEVSLRTIGASVIHSANRVGLLACRSLHAGLSLLSRAAGELRLGEAAQRAQVLAGKPEVEELLRFAVSDAHFELRRMMHIAVPG